MPVRRFVTFFVVLSILLLVAVAALNVIIDPYAEYGTNLVNPLVVLPRQDKYILMQDVPQPPQTLLLGSSRAITLRPSLVAELTGEPAFNAAVTRAMPLDYFVFGNYALQTYDPPPGQIYVFVDLQAMHPMVIWNAPDWLNKSPLRQYAGDFSASFSLEEFLTGLVSWRQASDSLQAMERIVSGADVYVVPYSAYGEMLDWQSPEHGTSEFDDYEFWESFTRIPPERFANLERVMALAADYDVALTFVFLPYSPDAQGKLAKIDNYVARDRELRDFLAARQPTYDFAVVDLLPLEPWDGDPAGFYDYYHITQENADRIITYLFTETDHAGE
jgi:hypothetical protein